MHQDIYLLLADLYFPIYNVMKLFGDNYKQTNVGEWKIIPQRLIDSMYFL